MFDELKFFTSKMMGGKKEVGQKFSIYIVLRMIATHLHFAPNPLIRFFIKLFCIKLRDILGGELYIFICKYKYMLKKINFKI